MKKLIISLVILGIFGAYGYRHGFKNLFIPFSMEKVKEKDIDMLMRKIKKDETMLDKEVHAAERLGTSYEKLGKKYLDNRSWTPAIEAYKKAIGHGKSSARTHFFLGQAYANRSKDVNSKNDADRAVHHYRRSIELNPRINDSHYGLAIALFYLKKERKQGLAIVKKITKRDPSYYEARFALGRFYYEMGEGSTALSIYERLSVDLDAQPQSTRINEYKKSVRANISRLMAELPRK